MGGRRFVPGNNTNVVQRYELATDRWTTLPALPQRLSGTGAAIIGGRLLVAGGENTTPAVAPPATINPDVSTEGTPGLPAGTEESLVCERGCKR